MEKLDVIDPFLEQLVASEPRRRRRPRVVLLIVAALVVVAVPAWAAGVFESPFHRSGHVPRALGHGYLVASGTTLRHERWWFTLANGRRLADGRTSGTCWALDVGSLRNAMGSCPSGGWGFMRRVSPRDDRGLFIATVPTAVRLVGFRTSRGGSWTLRPLRVDQRRARASGVPFPYSVVAIALPRGVRITGLALQDAAGTRLPLQRIGGIREIGMPATAAPPAQSPVI